MIATAPAEEIAQSPMAKILLSRSVSPLRNRTTTVTMANATQIKTASKSLSLTSSPSAPALQAGGWLSNRRPHRLKPRWCESSFSMLLLTSYLDATIMS
jgi:hypothetical protein